MKVAVTAFGDVSLGGGIVRIMRVFQLLQKKYDCTLISRGWHGSKPDRVIVIRPSKFWNFQLIPVILKNKFDVIYCSQDYFGFWTYFALSKIYNFKIIFEAHGNLCAEGETRLRDRGPIESIRHEICKWNEQHVVKYADCVIALSSEISAYYGRSSKRIVLVPVFVDEKKFRPRGNPHESKSGNDSKKIVGLIGAFVRRGVNISALHFVYRHIDEFDDRIKFVVIGRCDYRIQNARIEYTGYLSDYNEYADRLTRLDAVLVAGRFVTSGPLNKILEPMACAVPVFATPASAVGLDYVTDGEDIFICDESEIVAKVNESLFDAELMERVGENARRTVETFYGIAANERKLIKVLERVGSL